MVTEGKEMLQPRVQSFQELNLDFYFFNDNVFHFGKPNLLPLFKLIEDGGDPRDNPVVQRLVTEMANRLFTVCTVFTENPYI